MDIPARMAVAAGPRDNRGKPWRDRRPPQQPGVRRRARAAAAAAVSGDHVRVDASSQHTNCTELHRARFTQNMLRQSYDSAKATIDLRRTSNLQNIVRSAPSFSWVLFTRKIVRRSETVFVLLACAIPKRSFSTFLSHCRK